MAQQVQVLLLDDLDGGEAEETVSFGIDGKSYEIDLNSKNASQLRDALAPFVAAARKSASKGDGRRRQSKTTNRERSAEIRAWAKANGIEVSERGRIPASVVAKYEAAQRNK